MSNTLVNIKRATVAARLALANGVTLLDQTTLALTSSSGGFVNLYSVKADKPLTYKKQIMLSFMPDSLELKDDNTMLITGHPHLPSLAKFAESRHICNETDVLAAASGEDKKMCAKPSGLSWVAQ